MARRAERREKGASKAPTGFTCLLWPSSIQFSLRKGYATHRCTEIQLCTRLKRVFPRRCTQITALPDAMAAVIRMTLLSRQLTLKMAKPNIMEASIFNPRLGFPLTTVSFDCLHSSADFAGSCMKPNFLQSANVRSAAKSCLINSWCPLMISSNLPTTRDLRIYRTNTNEMNRNGRTYAAAGSISLSTMAAFSLDRCWSMAMSSSTQAPTNEQNH